MANTQESLLFPTKTMNAHAPFLKITQANINKMKLHTHTYLTTNIQLVLESTLVTEIA